MEQIIQLKSMRDAALVRLQNNPDYKLVNSLDALIQDLESVLSPEVNTSSGTSEEIDVDNTSENEELVIVEEPNASETISAGNDINSDVLDDDTLEELAVESPDEVSSAIEALEAELSQTVSGTDGDSLTPDPSIN